MRCHSLPGGHFHAADVILPAVSGRPNTKTLLITDDMQLARLLTAALSRQWPAFSCDVVRGAEDALSSVACATPDFVIVDADTPAAGEVGALERIRAVSSVPLVMVSTREDEAAMVSAIDRGADMYVTRPFDPEVLAARLRSLLRRSASGFPDWQPVLRFGDLAIDSETGTVHVGEVAIKLTPTERRLLNHLARNAGRVATKETLSAIIWQGQRESPPNHLKVFVSRLRAKIELDPRQKLIQTERGRGYKFVPPGHPSRRLV